MRLPCRSAYNRGGAGCGVIYAGCGVTCNAGFGAGFRCVYHVDLRITAAAALSLEGQPVSPDRGGAIAGRSASGAAHNCDHDGGCEVIYTGCGVAYTGCEVIYVGCGVTCNAGFGAGFRCVYHVDRRITAAAALSLEGQLAAPTTATTMEATGWTARAAGSST